ncbi:MAG: hypothetical protein JJU06_02900 [Ectothiorhodospiraceae bacterium]|nr:hypothetical protein [Ectothiorhodospiraceae bacterium]
MQQRISATPAVLTVELDLDLVNRGARPPAPLDRDDAEALGWALAEDLQRMLGSLNDYGLVVLGGLYDLTELLQPGLAMVDILMDLYQRSLPDTRFQPQLMCIGTQGEQFPVQAIAPTRQPGAGPLLAIPFLFLGTPEDIDRLSTKMEKTLLEKGQASLKTGQLITDRFGVQPLNLSYATFNDLCALLRIQLEHNGFAGLWQLLEASLFPGDKPTRVSLDGGNLFLIKNNVCYTRFLTYDAWATLHPETEKLQQGYADWQRNQRQYVAGLQAHGITVLPHLPGDNGDDLSEQDVVQAYADAQHQALPGELDFAQQVVIPAETLDTAAHLSLTEHRMTQLGPVAYSVIAESGDGSILFLAHEYPLVPRAVQTIPERWNAIAAELGLELETFHPGEMITSSNGRTLLPLPEHPGGGH